jgi:hypothetical protein
VPDGDTRSFKCRTDWQGEQCIQALPQTYEISCFCSPKCARAQD